jgi:hypothetical protein
MEILLPSPRGPARTSRWAVVGVVLLAPPVAFWAGLLLQLLLGMESPFGLLFRQVPTAVQVAGMLGCPVIAAGIGFAVRRRAATQAAKVLARAVVVCGVALAVLAALAALRPS